MKKIVKMAMFAFVMVFIMAFAAGNTVEAKGKVKKVQITAPTKKNRYTITRRKGNIKVQLKVNVTTRGNASKAVKYKSSNQKVASVSSAGILTVKKKGTATITVTSKVNRKKKDKLKVIVKQAVTGVSAGVKRPLASYNNVVSLVKGRTYTISAKITPSSASNKKLSYKSSKKSVAAVTSKGKITAKKVGTTKITFTTKDGSKKTGSFTVYVTDRIMKKVESLKAVADKDVLLVGETALITTTTTPLDATLQKVVYKSSNKKVAEVDAVTGKIKAVAPGNAKITVRAMDGSNKTTTVKIKVAELYTAITPEKDVTADVTVFFAGDKKKAAADVSRLILAATKAGDKKFVVVNGKAGMLENKDGKEVYVGDMTLVEYVGDKTGGDAEITVTYGANTSKAVAALELAKFAATGDYNYTIKIDGFVFSNLTVSADGVHIKIGERQYDAEIKQGVIYIKGDVMADEPIRELQNRRYARIAIVRR